MITGDRMLAWKYETLPNIKVTRSDAKLSFHYLLFCSIAMRFNRKDSRSLHRRAVLNYAMQRHCKLSKEKRRAKRLNNLPAPPLLKCPGRRHYGVCPEHDQPKPVSEDLQRLAVLKRAREGHCNPDEEEIYAKFINPPFVKYAEKLGYERYLAYDALLQKDEDATTKTLLMTVLQTHDSGLPGRRYHTF